MAEQKISTPSVIWNNINLSIMGGSVIYNEGFGEYKVDVQSAGGGATSNVTSRDISTAKSSLKFTLFPTARHIEYVRQMKNNFDSNVLQFTGEDDVTRSFTSSVLVNDPEIGLSSDGEIALEWESDPAS